MSRNAARLLFCLLLASCAPRHPFLIESSQSTLFSDVGVEYVDRTTLNIEETSRANAMMREANYEAIPRGGRILVHIKELTIGMANGDNWKVLVTAADGRTIGGREPNRHLPHYSTNYPRGWWNILAVDVNEKFDSFISVHVINIAKGSRTDFTIRPNPQYGQS